MVIQRIDLALDGVFLLHKQLFLLLGFGFIAGNVFQMCIRDRENEMD